MCPKTPYSKKDAQTVANYRTKGRKDRRHGRPGYLRVYACDICGHWHLTSKHEHDRPKS